MSGTWDALRKWCPLVVAGEIRHSHVLWQVEWLSPPGSWWVFGGAGRGGNSYIAETTGRLLASLRDSNSTRAGPGCGAGSWDAWGPGQLGSQRMLTKLLWKEWMYGDEESRLRKGGFAEKEAAETRQEWVPLEPQAPASSCVPNGSPPLSITTLRTDKNSR